ncbi:hypothetical protein [Gorillibacterium sp. sgz5001074]|uniref:hypothetical protein n=1 Tax=Gorillibacterium sp. sgz5001074 TaxID=3446695 RepID=UPI003F677C45
MKRDLTILDFIQSVYKARLFIVVTVLCVVSATSIVNFIFIKPNYEAVSLVKVNFDEKGQKGFISLPEEIRSDIVITKVIKVLNLSDSYDINRLRSNMVIQEYKTSNLIMIKVRGENKKQITDITNALASELAAKIELTDRLDKNAAYNNKSLDLKQTIAATASEKNTIEKELSQVPEKLVNVKAVADEPYMQSILNDQLNITNKNTGALKISSEESNPLYFNLKAKLAELTASLAKLDAEDKDINAKIKENTEVVNQLINGNNELNNLTSLTYNTGYKSVIINPALEPNLPIGSSKVVNIILSGIISAFLSVIAVIVWAQIRRLKAMLQQ